MNVIAEYRRAGSDRWLLVVGAPGETYAEIEASLHRSFEDLVGVRPRDEADTETAEPGAASAAEETR